jgi:hypothetical protein
MSVTPPPAAQSSGLHVNWSWPMLAAIAVALAGALGTILTPLTGSKLATAVQAALQAVSGLLVILGGGSVTTMLATAANNNHKAVLSRLAVEHLSGIRQAEYRAASEIDDEIRQRPQTNGSPPQPVPAPHPVVPPVVGS